MNLSIRQFRADLKAAFDRADTGEAVCITRKGVEYQLIRSDRVADFVDTHISEVAALTPGVVTAGHTPPGPNLFRELALEGLLNRIRAVEEFVARKVADNPDPEDVASMKRVGQAQLDKLWEQYHELKG